MEPMDYIVNDIKGEYAYLISVDKSDDEPLMIALFLLPHNVDVGTKVHYENLEYSVIE